jgi:hypothetical protein
MEEKPCWQQRDSPLETGRAGQPRRGIAPACDYARPVQEQVKQTQDCALRIMLPVYARGA